MKKKAFSPTVIQINREASYVVYIRDEKGVVNTKKTGAELEKLQKKYFIAKTFLLTERGTGFELVKK